MGNSSPKKAFDYLRRAGASDGGDYVAGELAAATDRRDKNRLWEALWSYWVLEPLLLPDPRHLELLLKLLPQDWHCSQEDIVALLVEYRAPRAVPALLHAARWVPSCWWEGYEALAGKAVWAIGAIRGPEADAALRELADDVVWPGPEAGFRADRALVRENALEQIERRALGEFGVRRRRYYIADDFERAHLGPTWFRPTASDGSLDLRADGGGRHRAALPISADLGPDDGVALALNVIECLTDTPAVRITIAHRVAESLDCFLSYAILHANHSASEYAFFSVDHATGCIGVVQDGKAEILHRFQLTFDPAGITFDFSSDADGLRVDADPPRPANSVAEKWSGPVPFPRDGDHRFAGIGVGFGPAGEVSPGAGVADFEVRDFRD
ncbi:hypothetical protein ACWCW7_17780 [Nocardia tengchongensis]